MCNLDRTDLENTPLHSHSDMTRQLEELEAHAMALRMADEATPYVLDDLVNFATQFARDVEAHIAEEELEFFPQLAARCPGNGRQTIDHLLAQHREIEDSLQVLLGYLDDASAADGELAPELVEAIYVRARLLRYAFTIHSIDEEDFFKSLQST